MRLFASDDHARKMATSMALILTFAAGIATALWIGRVQAAPATTPAPTTELAQQIAGKGGPPLSMSPDSIPSDYRLIVLIDAQGKSGYYATRGETLTIGTASYLLAYEVNIFTDEAGDQKIARGQSLDLSLINMNTVEIIRQITALPQVGTPPPPTRRQGQE
jgi:hypothetical protein